MPIPFLSKKSPPLTSDNWYLIPTHKTLQKVTIKQYLSFYGCTVQILQKQSLPQIVTSCVVIKHQLSLVRGGDFLDKNGMGISPDPFGGGAYNL